MDVASAASYLINRAVKMATGLNQNTKENTDKHGMIRSSREKSVDHGREQSLTGRQSSAYRISISNAAMQKMQLNSPPV